MHACLASTDLIYHLSPTQARASAPCILLMDQLETIAPRMESAGSESSGMRLIAALLNEIDLCARAGASESGVGVVILGTCRSLTDLDPRILRSGRLDQVRNHLLLC